MMRKPLLATVAIALTLGTTACGTDDDAGGDAGEQPSGQSSFTTDGSMPTGFPSAVPLPEGTVTASRGSGGGSVGWTVVTRVDQAVPQAFASAQSALREEGFDPTGKTRVRKQVAQRSYASSDFTVSITVSEASRTASLVSTQVDTAGR